MVRTDQSLSGTHLLCAVGRYQEACSQVEFFSCISLLDMIRVLQNFNKCLLIFMLEEIKGPFFLTSKTNAFIKIKLQNVYKKRRGPFEPNTMLKMSKGLFG